MLARQSALRGYWQTLGLTISYRSFMLVFVFDLHVLWENSRLQKPWKLLQKPFETPTKTIKSMQFPKKLGHIGFWLCFILVMPQNWKSWAFCFLFFWGGHSSHGHDGKFKDCVRITMPMGLHDLFCGHLKRLFPVTQLNAGLIKFTTSFWRDQNIFELASRKVEH